MIFGNSQLMRNTALKDIPIFEGMGDASSYGTSTTIIIPYPATMVIGEILICQVSVTGLGTNFLTNSWTANGWTYIGGGNNQATRCMFFAWKRVDGTEPVSLTLTLNGSWANYCHSRISRYSGCIPTGSPVEGYALSYAYPATNNYSATNTNSTTTKNSLAIAGYIANSSFADPNYVFSASTGYLIAHQNRFGTGNYSIFIQFNSPMPNIGTADGTLRCATTSNLLPVMIFFYLKAN